MSPANTTWIFDGAKAPGFSLDASVRIEATDRTGLERLIRYWARPPSALGRLHIVDDRSDQILYLLPGPDPSGRTALRLSGLDLLDRLAKILPPPRIHRHHYLSPVLQKPFHFGADIVLHYLGGTMDPHQAWLVLRGIRTLAMRVRTAQEIAQVLAQLLADHPAVAVVRHPGLPGHPQAELIARQMAGSGSLISFDLKGGIEAGRKVLGNVRIPALAVSLGGVESLIQHPASMTHAAVAREGRLAAGITDGLGRLAVGCEFWEDLVADLKQALDSLI